MSRMSLSAAASILVSAVVALARPATSSASCLDSVGNAPFRGSYSIVEYWTTTSPAPDDARCTWFPGGGRRCHMSGYLYVPEHATTGMPAVVYVHGSGTEKDQCKTLPMVKFFLQKGIVVFDPIGRGVGDSTDGVTPALGNPRTGPGFQNTGTYVEDWVDAHANGDPDHDARVQLDYLSTEGIQDVNAALFYLANNVPAPDGSGPLVDPAKIGLMGHSLGGAEVMLASKFVLLPLPAAVVDLSGGVLSWGKSHAWQRYLTGAATMRLTPWYLQQVANESPYGTMDSTVVPFIAANAAPLALEARMAVFSKFDVGDCAQTDTVAHCAHTQFMNDREQVCRWLPGVEGFLADHGVFNPNVTESVDKLFCNR